MQNKKRLALSPSKGFTIIELIVVIAIIAVLASIVMVNVMQYIAKSQKTAALADLKQISTLATTYFSETGSFANFYNDSRLINLEAAVNKINSTFILTVMDENGFSYTFDSASVVTGSHPTCSGLWRAFLRVGASGYFGCVDSTGFISVNGPSTDMLSCACIH